MMSHPYTAFWDGVTYNDVYDMMNRCIDDNYIKYNKDNSCEYDDGEIRCDPIDQPKPLPEPGNLNQKMVSFIYMNQFITSTLTKKNGWKLYP